MNIASRIYRRLARAFPHEFQLAYGADVMQLGEDVLRDIGRKHGTAGLLRLLADIAVRLPVEYASEMRRDMRYALRGLARSRGFAFVGILSMGLGIALTTMVYSSKWQLISRELPAAANARRLAMPDKPVSYYYVEQYRAERTVFAGVAAFQIGIPFNVTLPGDAGGKPQRVFGQLVSADYFSVLGMRPQRGRLLDAGLDRPGDAPVVVISDRFWRNRLNSAPDVLGRTLRLNGQPATIVGITPKDFNGALAITPAELFVPITVPASLAPELGDDVLHRRRAREFLALICLGPGVGIDAAEARLDAITRRLDAEDASLAAAADKGRRLTLVPAGTMVPIPRNVRPVISGFFAVLMALIMATACLNLANMLLARGIGRRKEIAIRLSVGASRSRLVRQMVSESIVLSLLGSAAGFALACVLAALRSSVLPPTGVPQGSDLAPDWHAAIFAFVLAVGCGIGFSLVPALRATNTQVSPCLKDDSTLRLPGYRRLSLRNLLMVAQVAGSVTLLLVTGFLVIGIDNATLVRTEFDPHKLYLLSLDPVRDGYSAEKAQALFERLPERLAQAGPVRSVALAAQSPYGADDDEDSAIDVAAGDPHGASRIQIKAVEKTVGAGYFGTLSEPILAGRDFLEADQRIAADSSTVLPLILSERAARGLFGNRNAIGQAVRDDNGSYEVVGIVREVGNVVPVGPPAIYLPLTRRNFARPPADGLTVMVRSDADADALKGIRRTIESIDPGLNVFNVQSLADFLDRTRSYNRFRAQTYGAIGLFGLVLAAIGLAGVTAYAVTRRRREIGIRMALGAGKGRVVRLVLREAAALVCVGTALGFICAIALAKILSALTSVFVEAMKVGTDDPRLLVGAPVLLAALTLIACYVPAYRAARVDPLKALRQE